jgi:hypothetical protein
MRYLKLRLKNQEMGAEGNTHDSPPDCWIVVFSMIPLKAVIYPPTSESWLTFFVPLLKQASSHHTWKLWIYIIFPLFDDKVCKGMTHIWCCMPQSLHPISCTVYVISVYVWGNETITGVIQVLITMQLSGASS